MGVCVAFWLSYLHLPPTSQSRQLWLPHEYLDSQPPPGHFPQHVCDTKKWRVRVLLLFLFELWVLDVFHPHRQLWKQGLLLSALKRSCLSKEENITVWCVRSPRVQKYTDFYVSQRSIWSSLSWRRFTCQTAFSPHCLSSPHWGEKIIFW